MQKNFLSKTSYKVGNIQGIGERSDQGQSPLFIMLYTM